VTPGQVHCIRARAAGMADTAEHHQLTDEGYCGFCYQVKAVKIWPCGPRDAARHFVHQAQDVLGLASL